MVLQNNKHKRTLQQRQNKKKKMKLKKKKEKQDARNLIRRCYIILRVGWNGMETEFRNFVARSWERTRCLVSTTIFYDRETIDKDNNTEIEIVNFLLFSPSIKILEDRDPRRFYLFVAERFRSSDAYHRGAEKHFFFLHWSSWRILLHDQTRISGIK